jgi:hypothetical protein
MSETPTLTIAYVGPQQAGVQIQATGQFVRPAGSPPQTVVDDDGTVHEIPTEVDVPADLARRLVAQDVWQPVGWGAGDGPAAGTIDEVLGRVGDDRDAAAAALAAEQAKGDKARTTLVDKLQALVAPTDAGDSAGITDPAAGEGGPTDQE